MYLGHNMRPYMTYLPCCTKTADQYTYNTTGSLISMGVLLLARHKKYQQSKYGPLSGLLIELKKIISSLK